MQSPGPFLGVKNLLIFVYINFFINISSISWFGFLKSDMLTYTYETEYKTLINFHYDISKSTAKF